MPKISQSLLRKAGSAPEAKKAAVAAFNDAEQFRELAVAHLKSQWQKIHHAMTRNTAYDKPAWSEYQADALGALRVIEEILKEVFGEEVN